MTGEKFGALKLVDARDEMEKTASAADPAHDRYSQEWFYFWGLPHFQNRNHGIFLRVHEGIIIHSNFD